MVGEVRGRAQGLSRVNCKGCEFYGRFPPDFRLHKSSPDSSSVDSHVPQYKPSALMPKGCGRNLDQPSYPRDC